MIEPAQALQSWFGLEACEVVDAGAGQAGAQRFVVESSGRRWIAKHYGEYYRDKAHWVRFECGLLRHLADAGEPVARNVPTRSGEPFAIVDGRPFVLYEWADGSIEWPASPENGRRLGEALARMHVVLDGYPRTGDERVYDVNRLIDRPLELLRPFSNEADHAKLVELCAEMREAIFAVTEREPCFGPIHGDIHQGNCHFEEGGKLSIFDFALCGIGYRAYDLTGFLWPMRDRTIENPAIRECCEAFLAGYDSVRPLEPAERAAIPAFVHVRTLWESGDWLDSGDGKQHPEEAAKMAPSLLAQFFGG